MTDIIRALIMGIVEGLTEFIPVSSTGHLIIAGELLGYTGAEAETFSVFIQLGAILAVLVHFRERFVGLATLADRPGFAGRRGVMMLALTTLPAVVIGLMAHSTIKALFSTQAVAIGLAVGAVWILLTERFFRHRNPNDIDGITWRIALGIGFFQCLAMWPGMSRSASTIMGGMYLGLRRKAATEYSFFAAVPMMVAACFYDLYKGWDSLRPEALTIFSVGFVAAFFSALLAIRLFIGFVSRHTFVPFAYYRLGVAAFLTWWIFR